MSLINDALRRASQSEKDRPRRAPAPMGMEAVPVARGSRLTVILAAVVLVALLLAGWFFWQWWNARNNLGSTVVTAAAAPPATSYVAPPPVAPRPALSAPVSVPTPVPAPVPVATVAPVAPVRPVPAPVVVAPATPVAVAPPVVAAPVAAPDDLPSVTYHQSPWPVDLRLNGIFFSQINPRVLINGNMYGVGDEFHGVVVKKIEKEKVTLEWNGHSRVLTVEGQ